MPAPAPHAGAVNAEDELALVVQRKRDSMLHIGIAASLLKVYNIDRSSFTMRGIPILNGMSRIKHDKNKSQAQIPD